MQIPVTLVNFAVQSHVNGEPYTLSRIVASLDVSSAVDFPHGHKAQRLDRAQGPTVHILAQEPHALLEEAVAVCAFGSEFAVQFELTVSAAAQGKHGVHEQRRAESMVTLVEIVNEVLPAEGSKQRVLPGKIQSHKMADQNRITGEVGPFLPCSCRGWSPKWPQSFLQARECRLVF